MKSMTAYAQISMPIKSRRFRLELQSLNKKGLDIQTDLPQTFLSLNIPIRLYLGQHLERGSVFVRLREEGNERAIATEAELISLKGKLDHLAQAVGFDSNAVTFNFLMDKAAGLLTSEFEMTDLEPLLKSAVDALIHMRQQEGGRLRVDFEQRFTLIKKTLAQIEILQKEAPKHCKEKLLERLKQLELTGADEERLAKEVVYYVEKQDVTEELTRLKSHLVQMGQLINAQETSGRKLEFLTQECFRELNTLSAKTSELAAVNLTLVLKTEFEKIKEQVMNIE